MCAVLGGILLLLCVILAAFFVYAQFKKHCGRRSRSGRPDVFHLPSRSAGHYSVVPAGDPEVEANGIVLKRGELDVAEDGGGGTTYGRRLIPGGPKGGDGGVRVVLAGSNGRGAPQVRAARALNVLLIDITLRFGTVQWAVTMHGGRGKTFVAIKRL